jgi:hypothetical protein
MMMKSLIFLCLAAAVFSQSHDGAVSEESSLLQMEETFSAANNHVDVFLAEETEARRSACVKAADASINDVYNDVKNAQKFINKMPNGRSCAGRNQHLINLAQRWIKRSQANIKTAKRNLTKARRSRIGWDFSFESLRPGQCHPFFRSGQWAAVKRKVQHRTKLLTNAKATLRAAQQNLRVQIHNAKRVRNQCRCNVKKSLNKQLALARKLTPERRKSILREMMVKCLVAARGKGKNANRAAAHCKNIFLSKAQQNKLAFHMPRLARGVAAAKCNAKGGAGWKHSGTGWCETFHTCRGGDKRNFWAWVKKQGYKRYKGACSARANTRVYGRRHKFWGGKFTYKQCRAKCDAMGRSCEGITMPASIRRSGRAAPKKIANPSLWQKRWNKFMKIARANRHKEIRAKRKAAELKRKAAIALKRKKEKAAKALVKREKAAKARVRAERKAKATRREKRAKEAKNKEKKMKTRAEKSKKAKEKLSKARVKAVKYISSGTGWCETFHTCRGGDKRNFWAWVKKQGYKRYKGACSARANSRVYGRRHKYWPGKFTYKQCRAKCDAMGRSCEGITMPANIKQSVFDARRERAGKAHRAERQYKRARVAAERTKKYAARRERQNKERVSKERKNKERNNKEKSAKRAREKAIKAHHERRGKAAERLSKERTAKERRNKERNNKARARERRAKEAHSKERSRKAEKATKERRHKQRIHAERSGKERNAKAARVRERTAKERNSKAKVERDRKAHHERRGKAHERSGKERSNKERSAKERNNKARARERAYKASRLRHGQCCWLMWGCRSCCDKCPGGHHWVWPHVCGTSRRCNRI